MFNQVKVTNSMAAGDSGAGSLPDHRTGLRPVRDDEVLGGFNNLFNKEIKEWLGARRWLRHAVGWLALIDGFLAFILFVVPQIPDSEASGSTPPVDLFSEGTTIFLTFVFIAGAIGAVINALDEIVGEKQQGTAGWILSKPVTRMAFVLSKLLAAGIGIVAFVAILTGIVAYAEISIAVGYAIPVGPFLGGLSLATLGVLYFLALTIMLGTLFDDRRPVLGISLGVLLAGATFVGLVPQLGLIAPFNIHEIAAAMAISNTMPADWPITVASTIASIVAFSVIACWRFEREEL